MERRAARRLQAGFVLCALVALTLPALLPAASPDECRLKWGFAGLLPGDHMRSVRKSHRNLKVGKGADGLRSARLESAEPHPSLPLRDVTLLVTFDRSRRVSSIRTEVPARTSMGELIRSMNDLWGHPRSGPDCGQGTALVWEDLCRASVALCRGADPPYLLITEDAP